MISGVVEAMGPGPLSEEALVRHVHPLFARVLSRGEIYLANHSLGRPLDRTLEDVGRAVALWQERMDEAWEDWLLEMDLYRASIARLIGCSRADAVVPKTSAGQGLRAVLNALRTRTPVVVTTEGEFDSIDFILRAYEARGRARVVRVGADANACFDAGRIVDAIERGVDLVVVSAVYFSTGQVLEGIGAITARAKEAGALVLLDAYHAAGALPLDVGALGVDFAIGGNYKYTRGGPGAGWLMVGPRHLDGDEIRSIDTGWFAKKGTFEFGRTGKVEYAAGGDAWLEATPSFLPAYQAKAGLELTLSLGVERLRAYSLEQCSFLEGALRRRGVAVRTVSPRGAFLLVASADSPGACAALKRAGVNTDARPDPLGRGHVRLCPDILNTREEMERAAVIVGRTLSV